MNRSIDVIVSPTGQTVLQTHGFTGPSCREASRQLEAALGIRGSESLTSEFHQSLTSGQHEEHSLRAQQP